MSAIKIDFLRRLAQSGAIAALGAVGSSAWAQVCSYEIVTVPGPIPANVPSLSMLGVALLAAAVGFLAWRQGKFPGARLMAIALVAAAAMLVNHGGGGLVQKAYAAALSLTNPAGETQSVSELTDGETVTFTNTSGVPLRIASVSPAADGCAVGSIIPNGGNCAIQAVCPVVLECGPNGQAIDGVCTCKAGYENQGGDPQGLCVPVPLNCPEGEMPSSLNPPTCVCGRFSEPHTPQNSYTRFFFTFPSAGVEGECGSYDACTRASGTSVFNASTDEYECKQP